MSKKPKPPKTPVALTDLEENLRDQLGFLKKSAKAFDEGDLSEFRRMATTIRVLLHDTRNSYSLAGQLGLKNLKFFSGAHPFHPENMLTELCLVSMHMGAGAFGYISNCNAPHSPRSLISFDDWWNDTVLKDTRGTFMSRSDFILVVANQAGGAHVDHEIDERYHGLTKEFTAGWSFSSGPGAPTNSGVPLEHIEKMYIRQIAFETIATLEPAWLSIVGNRGCDCKSGRKARYCCLK